MFWVATHRRHHQHSDTPEDPHTPHVSGFWAHMGWIMFGEAGHNDTVRMAKYAPDLAKDPFYRWLTTYHWVPLTVLGFGLLPKVLVIALVTFVPIAVGLIEGFAATDRQATNLLRSMGASRWKQFRYVRLPGAMPSFFTALRIGITYAVTGAIFAEYVGATAGLGIFMSLQKNSVRTDGDHGNAFLSRFPMLSHENIDISDHRFEQRDQRLQRGDQKQLGSDQVHGFPFLSS